MFVIFPFLEIFVILLVPYIRNADGSIVRVKDGFYIASTKEMGPYVFEEQLYDWPEPKVYWAKESGRCLGVAPYTRRC